MSKAFFHEHAHTDGAGRPITPGDLVTADVPICCAIRRGPGFLSDDAMYLLERTGNGRTHAIVGSVENGKACIVWPDGLCEWIRAKMLRVDIIGIERRRNAGRPQ